MTPKAKGKAKSDGRKSTPNKKLGKGKNAPSSLSATTTNNNNDDDAATTATTNGEASSCSQTLSTLPKTFSDYMKHYRTVFHLYDPENLLTGRFSLCFVWPYDRQQPVSSF